MSVLRSLRLTASDFDFPKENAMHTTDSVIAVFPDHNSAETAIKNLAASGFDMKNLSVVGKGYHTEEKVVGFYNAGDRIKIWGSQGAFWGGLWGLFFGGLILTVPLFGYVFILGSLAATVAATLEGALVGGGLSGLAAGLYSLGVPKDSIIEYEAALKADSFLVMAHGSETELSHARQVLDAVKPTKLDTHSGAAETDLKAIA